MAPQTQQPHAKLGSGDINTRRGKLFGPLEQVFDDVWWAWGTITWGPIDFPRTMTIFREQGALVVVHPIMMPPEVQAQIEALGPIGHIIRLGAFHGMDDPLYVERYRPTTWAPPGIDVRGDYQTDREIAPGGELPLAGACAFDFEKSKSVEAALLIARHGGILHTCDSVQNWESTHTLPWLSRTLLRAGGFRGRACIGPGWRKMYEPKDGSGFRPHFEALLEHDFKHVLSGHGAPVLDTAKDDLRATIAKIYG